MTSTEIPREYLDWARHNIGGNEPEIVAAAQALTHAKAARSTPEQAVAAAQEAARRARVASITPPPPGKVAGIARGVTRTTQLGTRLVMVDFEIDRGADPPMRVQIRGKVINGRIENGDEIVADKPPNGGRFIQADRVFNRTWNSTVETPKNRVFRFALEEAEDGEKIARWKRRVAIGGLFYAAMFFLIVVSGFIFVGCQLSGNAGHTAPDWFCEQATSAGITDPPGC